MKVLVREKLSPHKSKTPEGYLVCTDAILARTGTQEYYASELYPDVYGNDDIVSVDRKPEEVFSPATLASFENKPLTIEHPEDGVTPDNYKDLAVGFVRDIHRGKADGKDVILGNVIITDSEAIDLVESGRMTELSCGYDCDITDGEFPQQTNIRGNHVALCEQGRAGNARIVDSLDGRRKRKMKAKDALYEPNGYIYRGYEIWYDWYRQKYVADISGDKNEFDTLVEAKGAINKEIESRKTVDSLDTYKEEKFKALNKKRKELENSNTLTGDDPNYGNIKKAQNNVLNTVKNQMESLELSEEEMKRLMKEQAEEEEPDEEPDEEYDDDDYDDYDDYDDDYDDEYDDWGRRYDKQDRKEAKRQRLNKHGKHSER